MEIPLKKSEINKLSQIVKIIKQSKTFFIAGHVKPDGDSIGSALALYSVLTRMGKTAAVYCQDEIPAFLKFLKGANKIKKSARKTDMFDCAIILESVNFSRMGDIITPNQAKKIINIDHHTMFTNFGDVNYIVPSSSSTAELIFNIFQHMKIKPTKEEAQNLYVGILTDTGRFQQLNTTANSHIVSAKLIDYGVSPADIRQRIYDNNSLESIRLLGLVLSDIRIAYNGQMAYLVLTKNMLKKSGANENELESLVSYTLMIKGVKVGCLFKEVNKNVTKVSFRSVKNFNVLNIVKKCGGGGHKNAAGCSINANLNTAIKIIKKAFNEKFDA